MTAYDVAIIGAGVHGASAAFHLASQGARVVVFERYHPAAGPTGRSSAICRTYYTNVFLARVAHESLSMFEEFGEVTGGRDAGFRRTGALFLHGTEDIEQVGHATGRLNSLGIESELIEPADIAHQFPFFDLHDIGIGVWQSRAGYADPAGTTTGLLGRARDMGTEIRARTRIARIGSAGTAVELIDGSGNRTAAGRVLIAAGPWTRPLAAELGVSLPLHVERHIVAIYDWDAFSVPFIFMDIPGGYYCKPEGMDQFLAGSLLPAGKTDPERFAERVGQEETLNLALPIVRRIPKLSEARVRGGWASLYDVSPDWQPVIGAITDRIFVNAGTSGHGFKLAPALGRYVADLVLGKNVPELDQFSPGRFTTGNTLDSGYGTARILG